MPCCDTDGPQKHQKLRPVTDTAHNRRCSSLWKRAGWTHVHIWCAHVAAHSCVFVCWYVRTFPMFTRPPLQQETHVFSWQGWGEPGGATAAQRKQRRKVVCCCRLRQRGSAEGAQGSDVKVNGVFFIRPMEGERSWDVRCWWWVCESFKKRNPQGGDSFRVDNEQ